MELLEWLAAMDLCYQRKVRGFEFISDPTSIYYGWLCGVVCNRRPLHDYLMRVANYDVIMDEQFLSRP